MTLNADICYRAVRSRDARFDGRFFTAVVSTGIYCRPICPARLPARANVRFYSCAAAAEEAGFRPCRRCRPETSPGTPAWSGTSATVTRALRLISNGALDEDGNVDALAEKLGVTARHLRRLFDDHLGASPVAIAQARRVHFAKTLLDGTALPITEIALNSGFNSIRRFNSVFKKTFHRAPREVRERSSVAARNDGALQLRLSYREPYDLESILSFLAPRAIPGVECVADDTYQRTVCIDGDAGVITVSRTASSNHIELQIPTSLSHHTLAIVERTRRLFDLCADSGAIEEQLRASSILRTTINRFPGTRIPGAWIPFETSVRAILGQQISVKGATTLAGRLVQNYGERVEEHGACSHLFPQPARLRRARFEGIGVTTARARALRALAAAFDDGEVVCDGSCGLDEVIEQLSGIPGVGPWTANYIAMRACGEPDAFPSGDLALLRAGQRLDPKIERETDLTSAAEAWKPWRAYAAMFLWRLYGSD